MESMRCQLLLRWKPAACHLPQQVFHSNLWGNPQCVYFPCRELSGNLPGHQLQLMWPPAARQLAALPLRRQAAAKPQRGTSITAGMSFSCSPSRALCHLRYSAYCAGAWAAPASHAARDAGLRAECRRSKKCYEGAVGALVHRAYTAMLSQAGRGRLLPRLCCARRKDSAKAMCSIGSACCAACRLLR